MASPHGQVGGMIRAFVIFQASAIALTCFLLSFPTPCHGEIIIRIDRAIFGRQITRDHMRPEPYIPIPDIC